MIGAGPAGLATAIRLKQRNARSQGLHAREGLDHRRAHPFRRRARARTAGCAAARVAQAPLPICVPVKRDEFHGWLAARARTGCRGSRRYLHNEGNFIISLGGLVHGWRAQAEGLGVDVFAGFAAALPLFDDDGSVAGVQIGDMGVQHDGSRGPNYTPGPEVRARLTVIAEGCRGSLAKVLIKRYKLDANADPQVYALGMKELWQLPPGRVQPGLVQHSVGWPLDSQDLRRQFRLSPERQPRVRRLRHRARLPRSALLSLRGLPAIQASPGDARIPQGRRNPLRRRARDRRGWLPVPAQARDARRRAGRRCGAARSTCPRSRASTRRMRCAMAAADYFAENNTSIGFDAVWRKTEAVAELHEVRNIKPGSSAACASAC